MWGKTALLAACYGGHSQAVRLLVAAGADTSVRSRNGYSAGEYAKFGCDRERWHGGGDWQGCQRAIEMGQEACAAEADYHVELVIKEIYGIDVELEEDAIAQSVPQIREVGEWI